MGEVFCKKKTFCSVVLKAPENFLGLAVAAIFLCSFFLRKRCFASENKDQPVVAEDVAKVVKEDPRADRAKERFERKDAKKAEIAEHKAEKKAIKADRDAAKVAAKAERDAARAERKANRAKEM